MPRTSQTNFTALLAGEVGLHYTDVQQLARGGRRRKGIDAGTWSLQRKPGERGRSSAGLAAVSTSVLRCRLRTLRVWLRSAAGVAERRPQQRRREFLFRRLRQQLRRRQNRSSATANTTRCRDSGSTSQRAQFRARNGENGTCRRTSSESVGTPGFYLNWLRPSVFAAGLLDRSGQLRRCARTTRAWVRQADLRFSVLHWYDMTLSVGYAVGYQGSRARRYRVDDLAEDHVERPSLRTMSASHPGAGAGGPAAGALLPRRAAIPRQLQAGEAAARSSRSSPCGALVAGAGYLVNGLAARPARHRPDAPLRATSGLSPRSC